MIVHINIALTARFPNGCPISPSDFVDRLGITPEDRIIAISTKPSPEATARLVFLNLTAPERDYEDDKEWVDPYLSIQEHIADWLRRRENALFAEFRSAGLQMDLLLSVRMDQDQIDGTLYSKLLAACGEKGIGIELKASPAA